MLLDYETSREIYLVFMDANYVGSYFLKRGFRHVYTIERQAFGWISCDPSKSDLHVNILPAPFFIEIMPEFVKQNPDTKILEIKMRPHTKSRYPKFGMLSCTSVIQYTLGVYWPLVLTPYKLYNKLIKNPPEHIEVTPWQDTHITRH